MSNVDFAAEGFLQHSPGQEFLVQGHGLDNSSGLLAIRVVVTRQASGHVIDLGNKQGLKLHASFDDARPDMAMLEAIGPLDLVEHLAKSLAGAGFHRLPDQS